ncbi:hypothetical protein Sfulv_58580 [Streptomyces fulvorobeus]|uniref:Uncharacterized protein n=1 Tax=Streptomyces fulvorobeus TaxID=284028 RepID=A0A7J0CFN0_9ACTN|nr:hypothetical protein [Streptomyces fulvorobeus]GFN01048.1 hypothetical protein Sfulv_58580 [Streptomyces fulvorobeus]
MRTGTVRKDLASAPRPRRRPTRIHPHGIRHLRSLDPVDKRTAIICDSYFPHLATERRRPVTEWFQANSVEIACTPTKNSQRATASGARAPPWALARPVPRRAGAVAVVLTCLGWLVEGQSRLAIHTSRTGEVRA